MTTATKKSSKAGGPKGNVDIILDKLQPNIQAQLFGSPTYDDSSNTSCRRRRRRASLVSHAEEALRLLNIKRVRLLKDNAMVRAALVIDYLSRNAEASNESKACQYSQTAIPIAMLANVIGFTNKKDVNKFQSMQTVIASYLDGTSIDQRKKVAERKKTQNRSRKRDHSDTAPLLGQGDATTAATGTKITTGIKPSSLIRQLCIQLGTMISDAEFVTSYAEQLFSEVQSTTTTLETAMNCSKREMYNDIERNQVYYEAACFYLAVKKNEGDRSHSLVKDTTTAHRKERRRKGNHLHQGLNEDDVEEDHEVEVEEERPLNEFDVIREANLLERTFRTVLTCVRGWAQGFAFSLNSDMSRDSRSGSNASGDGNGDSTKRLFVVPDMMDGVADDQGGRKCNPHRDTIFEQWKKKVLHDAKMSVQEHMKEGDKQGDWLSIAAEEVLSKAGLNK